MERARNARTNRIIPMIPSTTIKMSNEPRVLIARLAASITPQENWPLTEFAIEPAIALPIIFAATAAIRKPKPGQYEGSESFGGV